MKKVFIETSVFIRYLTKDDPDKFNDCVRLFERIEEGKLTPYVSNVVIMEIIFVLIGLYRFSKRKVLAAVADVLKMRNVVLIEKTNTKEGLKQFKSLQVKYGDCLIVTQVPDGSRLLTYDADFRKFPSLAVASPKEAIT